MKFVSYAQNLEDVMLWRIFKTLPQGFYIDVGAYDPVVDSVTKAFYDHGWRGINMEPAYPCYQRLCQVRTEDINLPIAAGAKDGLFPYYEIPDSGLSTLDGAIAEQHRQNGWPVVKSTVSVLTLATICRQYVKESIHFLKVDVEGTEQQVLQGMNFQQYRPWIVLVEATLPLGQMQNYADWESILLDSDYQYVYFDGLNRFYIANEKAVELKPHFYAPPNFFDGYQRYAESACQKSKTDRLLQPQEETTHEFYFHRPEHIMAPLWPAQAEKTEQVSLLTERLRQDVDRRRQKLNG
ncbi:methyltransferase fkbm [Lucifera butyrica]|uniref:Methyltransferase fkbm n=1 Tax=Lucifera butyrica TaxID=1351585 RepID=A0A498R7R9_9FIRM|nr:FkbM family methyltransferase [Lucifera butyrica]VBB05178.1 methyltransferase fkbm [Lucifera butyrica]